MQQCKIYWIEGIRKVLKFINSLMKEYIKIVRNWTTQSMEFFKENRNIFMFDFVSVSNKTWQCEIGQSCEKKWNKAKVAKMIRDIRNIDFKQRSSIQALFSKVFNGWKTGMDLVGISSHNRQDNQFLFVPYFFFYYLFCFHQAVCHNLLLSHVETLISCLFSLDL